MRPPRAFQSQALSSRNRGIWQAMRCGIFIVVNLIFLQRPTAQEQAIRKMNYPVRVSVQTDHKAVAGTQAVVKIVLLDRENQVVPADMDISVTVNVKWPSGKVADFSVPIKTGASTAQLAVPMKAPGLCRIRATESHLLSASAFVIINDPSPKANPVMVRSRIAASAPLMRGGDVVPPPQQAPPPVVTPAGTPGVTIVHNPDDRAVLADGKDFATIEAFLDLPAREETSIYLSNSNGTLKPSVLVIPKDSQYASATLISRNPGYANISTPTLVPKPEAVPFTLKFSPPISGLKFIPAEQDILWIENAEILVELVDSSETPLKADTPWTIALAVAKGDGELANGRLTIPAGEFSGHTTFIPSKSGVVTVSASTGGFRPQQLAIRVGWPIWQLIFSILGGIAGGFLAKLQKNTEHWRILVGVITGLVLYWAFVFGLLHVLPHSVTLNLFSAAVISVLGGWLGTGVFSTLMSPLGLKKAD